MSHFKAVQSREDFKLASGFKVPGTVAQYVRGFQLEGVKFIADHLLNQESCILNDQSGLGKTAVVVAFFSAFANANKRAVIIVNDESNVLHWQYHFEKLGKISVGAIDEEGASTKEAIQIVRWSALVNNPRILSRFNYQIVVLDNRGNCLSNKICESFMLKNFEGKVQLLVDSEDLTSDLDLLYTSFKLIGRLEKKYERKSVFLDRFSLPGAQDKLVKEKDYLERYYMLRNVIRDYCGSYRLRRYAHQYEQYMPLTNKSDFEKNFQHWLGIGSNQSETIVGNVSSQDSVKIISSNSSASTNELFETLYLSPKSQDITQNAQNFLDHEEETMPPLMFEDESDTEQPKSEKSPPSTSSSTNKKPLPAPKKVAPKQNVDSEERKRLKLAKMLEIDFTSKYQVNKSILKSVEKAAASNSKDKPIVVKKEPKRLSPVKMLLPIREPKLKSKPVNKQLEKLKKLLDIDCTPKHQYNKNVLDDVKQEKDEVPKRKVVEEKQKERDEEKKKERDEEKKKERVEEKKKERVEEKKKEKVEEKKKEKLEEKKKEKVEEKKKEKLEEKKKESSDGKKKDRALEKKKESSDGKKNTESRKPEKTENKKKSKNKIKENGEAKSKKNLEELNRRRLERLLQIDFTPKYQLNNISRKLYKTTKTRDLKETPKVKKRAKEQNTSSQFQNAQKFVESASPDTTTQDFIPAARMKAHNSDEFSIDIDKEIAKLKDTADEVEVEEVPLADVIVLSDDSEPDDDDDFVSPDIFGGQLDELITDDESINCSQALPAQKKTQTPSAIKPAKPKKSSSCLQQLESQDLSTDGHNFMDVYSEFLQAQKSNETSPIKSTTNNSKPPVSTGNKITKYFGGSSNAHKALEILKTPTRRKSFSGMRRSPKTPPNIQNNNIMTWLVRPSSSSAADHQDSSITSSSKDIKRRRLELDY